MNVLVACEESQRVAMSFRDKGHCGSYSHKHGGQYKGMFTTDRAKNRAKTFPGVAKAMADQWG